MIGPNGMCSGTVPIIPNALATYVRNDMKMMTGTHPQCADWNALKLSPTWASCGRMK